MGSTMFDPEWTRRLSQRARDMALERIQAHGREGGRAQDPATTALSNDIADLKGRTEFLKTGMDNLMAEVQKASIMAAHAQYYAQQAMAASEEMQRILKRRQEEEEAQESQRQKERKHQIHEKRENPWCMKGIQRNAREGT